MANPVNTACTCTRDGYSPECPQVFVQGGRLLHALDAETKLKPRQYEAGDELEKPTQLVSTMPQQLVAREKIPQGQSQEDGVFQYQVAPDIHLRRSNTEPPTNDRAYEECEDALKYSSSEHLRMGNANSLNRFKPLMLRGQSINQATIGGFQLDMKDIVDQVRDIAPLPPVALPLIFKDTDLNFCHHFFQGLEIIAGQKFIDKLSQVGKYSGADPIAISPIVSELIRAGYVDGDSELVIFLKRVISFTFCIPESKAPYEKGDVFIVRSNFYGFQYIESGMQCREQDLKMWLHAAWMQYRTLWFNAFKSSGVPLFARSGVQDRYDSMGYLAHRSSKKAGRASRESVHYRAEERRRPSPPGHRSHRRDPSPMPESDQQVSLWKKLIL